MTMRRYALFVFVLGLLGVNEAICGAQAQAQTGLSEGLSPPSDLKLQEIPFKIVYETYRKTNGQENWELFLINADGSKAVNLTNTADVNEMYPHASPDGTKICFVADEIIENKKVRNIYYMNIDGSGRIKVAENAREPCWSPDGSAIAYVKGEFDRYTTTDYATKGLFIYELATGDHKEHPNMTLLHLYNICWTPDGKWFVATVHGAMGYKHTNLAIESHGTKVFDLKLPGCRPDVSLDGTKVVWCPDEKVLWIGDLVSTASAPEVKNRRILFTKSGTEIFQQQADWSPDGKFVAFARGPKEGGEGRYPVAVGNKASGWNICVGNLAGEWVQITTDGNHNKEPDWVPIQTRAAKQN